MDDKPQPHTNGSLKKGSTALEGANGHLSNGHISDESVSPKAPRRTKTPKRQRGFLTRAFNVIARLLTWYSIFTVLFRCPASLDACDETSPKICKPYFHAKHFVSPHVSPYYDAYAAPYVSLARPYYDTLDRSLITPGRTYAVRYGGPRVAQVQAYGHAQWEKNVQPQILKYQAQAKAQYDHAISPYVDNAVTTFAPYYDIARTNALQTYHEILVPTFTFLRPYATQGYEIAYGFTNDAVIPSTVWVWNKTYAFLDSAVWPHVRDVYVLKVEPQLVRIGKRLGRYNEKKPKPIVEGTESVPVRSTFTKPAPSVSSTTSSATEEPTPTASRAPDAEHSPRPQVPLDTQSKPSETPKTKEEIRELAAKTVAEDLELWQGKFTQVAEEGASEIEDRVHDISARMIESHANTMGKSLVKQLETTVQSELEQLRKTIIEILKSGKNDSEERDEKVASAIRGAGLTIKNKAQSIRDWRHSYEQETEIAVTKAVEEHFSILEQTRDLALQKIGMKWAWMDGVTYKDWQNYHQLKDRFEEWIEDFKRLITTHPGLTAAQAAGTDVEDEGMAIAHEAAVELGRLKQVAAWKATADDFTGDFDSETMQLAAEAAEKRVAEAAINQAATGDDTVSDESSGDIESNSVSPKDTSALPSLGNLVKRPPCSSPSPESSSIRDAQSASIPADEANVATPIEPLPTSDPIDGPEQMQETILESSDLPIHSIVEEAGPTTVKSALFGAAAESVPTRQPIFDDDAFASTASSVLSVAGSDVPAKITSAARSAYTVAIGRAADQYYRAMSAVSAQDGDKPAHEVMLSSVSNEYFSAVAAANSQLDDAITAVSKGLYGTPTTKWSPEMPTVPSVDWERVQSIAHQRLQDSVNWASEQYESAKVAIGAAEPTPSTYLEEAETRAQKLLDQAKHNYFAGVGIAHARYSEFLSAASTAVSSLTATPTPTNIQESASSVISVAGEAAEAAASSAADLAREARSSIDENWNLFVSRVSSEIYGAPTPTPWYENLYAAAGDYASQADDLAVSATEVIVDQISIASSLAEEYAASAQSAASSQYVVVSSIVSELIHGKEPSFTESVYMRLAQVYTTGLSSASSIGSVVSATAASAASKVSDAAGSQIEAVGEGIASATNKASSIGSVISATAVSAASKVSDAASSRIDEVGEGVASATDKVKDAVDHTKDEL